MTDNTYMTKLEAQWEQLQADWKKSTAEAKEAAADEKMEQDMKDLENQFTAAKTMTEDKLKQWGAEAEAKMHELSAAFNKQKI